MRIFLLCCVALVSFGVMGCQSTQSTTQPAHKPIIALVLGGGGARGFAHLGVIDTLEQNGIRADIVIGTSAGAVVGAIYASGKTPSELYALADDFDINQVLAIAPAHQGVIDATPLRHYINANAGKNPTAFPKIFAAVGADPQGQATLFTNIETGLMVQASSSVPKLFIAPRIPDKVGKKYTDGGTVALVPARFAKQLGADIVIAVDVMGASLPAPNTHAPKANKSLWHYLPTPTARMAPIDKQNADVIITPNTATVSVFDLSAKQRLIISGQAAAKEQLTTIKTLIKQKTTPKGGQVLID